MTNVREAAGAIRVGDIEIIPLLDGFGVEVAREILGRPGVSDAWHCYHEHLGPDGTISLPLGGFAVRRDGRVSLVDAGVGAYDDGKYAGGGLPDALRANGIAPEDVSDVVFTHLHFDHIGWASHRGQAFFPNATYRVHRADWEYFVTAHDADRHIADTMTAVESQVELFDGDHTVAPGLDAVHTPGHTPGTTVYVVSSGTERALLLGDVVHSVVQLGERDWEVIWDFDPRAAGTARNRIADECADTDDLVVAAHFPNLQFGRIITTGGQRRFVSN
ncbi:MBL fold metallo-hydrolase [Nocardia sp. NPDC088792]|uniref:MBL fold metallo-hydrolase n=1 Tax=Nocardia sp. NPDC088792 TaxID=3364332 RepID=UPI0038053ED6